MPYRKSKKNSTSSKKSNTGGRRRKHTVKKARRVRKVMRGGVMVINGGSLPNLVTFKDIIETVGSNEGALNRFYGYISKDWMNRAKTEVYGPDQESFEKNPSIKSMTIKSKNGDDEVTKDGDKLYLLSKWRSVNYPITLINTLLLNREFSVDDIVYILFDDSIKQLILREDLFKPIKDLVTPTEFESIKINQEALKTLLKGKSEIKKAVEDEIRAKYSAEQISNNMPLTALIGKFYHT